MTGVPKRKRKDTQDVATQSKGPVRAQREGGRLQAKERGLKRNQTCQHFHLGLLDSGTVKQLISVI